MYKITESSQVFCLLFISKKWCKCMFLFYHSFCISGFFVGINAMQPYILNK